MGEEEKVGRDHYGPHCKSPPSSVQGRALGVIELVRGKKGTAL